jgi:hypothetical protein
MTKRTEAYKNDVSEKLRDPEFANGYIQALIFNHDMSFKTALAEMIDAFGQVEFSDESAIKAPNVSRMVERLRANENIKEETLERLLNVFGLTLTIGARVADHDELKEA